MKLISNIGLNFTLSLAFGYVIANAQVTPVEVFPLKTHLHYSYEYSNDGTSYWSGHGLPASRDSGTVDYVIGDSWPTSDSTVSWNVQQIRNLCHWDYLVRDTSYYIQDTTSLALVEQLQGNHNLTIEGMIWRFPLENPLKQISRFDSTRQVNITHPWTDASHFLTAGYDSVSFSDSLGPFYFYYWSYAYGFQNGSSSSVVAKLRSAPITNVFRAQNIPLEFELAQNFPNPFNPTTTIEFTNAKSSFTTIRVFDIFGREIATIASSFLLPGKHAFLFNGANLCSGVYFCQAQSNGVILTRKMILLK